MIEGFFFSPALGDFDGDIRLAAPCSKSPTAASTKVLDEDGGIVVRFCQSSGRHRADMSSSMAARCLGPDPEKDVKPDIVH